MYNNDTFSVVMFDEDYIVFSLTVFCSGKYIYNEGDFTDYLTIALRNVAPYEVNDENDAILKMVLPKYKDRYYVNKIVAKYVCNYTGEVFEKEIPLE